MMKHPIQWVLFSGGSCMGLAAILFVAGIGFNQPALKSVAKWLWIAAVVIAFLPLIILAVVTAIEKLRRK